MKEQENISTEKGGVSTSALITIILAAILAILFGVSIVVSDNDILSLALLICSSIMLVLSTVILKATYKDPK